MVFRSANDSASRRHARPGLHKALPIGAVAMALGLLFLAACGGGGGAALQGPPHILPSVQPSSSITPQSASTSIPFSAVARPIALPGMGGYSESITMPPNDQSGTGNSLKLTISTQPITGLPALQSIARKPNGMTTRGRRPYAIAPSGGTGILYFSLNSPVAVTLSALPALTITLPTPANPALNYYLAVFGDPNGGWQTEGQLKVSGSVVTFSGSTAPLSLVANGQYGVTVYTAPPCSQPCLTASMSIPFSAVGTPVALPGVGGYSESMTLPPNDQSGTSNTLTVTISTQALSGLPTLQSIGSKRALQTVLRQSTATGFTPTRPYNVAPTAATGVLYFGLRSSIGAAFNFPGLPALAVTLPAPTNPALNYYAALYDPTNPAAGWQPEGQLAASGSALMFPGPPFNFYLSANNQFGLTIYTAPRCTPPCVTDQYPLPTVSGGAGGITAGPDGSLWFAETQANKIGKITTSGTITEYPTSGSYPSDIAAGPDGNVWFIESGSNKVGKITPGGTITEFALPSISCTGSGRCVSSATGITPGPDGNVWFLENFASSCFFGCHAFNGRVGKITPSGAITEFPIPSGGKGLGRITKGPDGNLWFTESGAIGKVTTGGAITEYPAPPTGQPIAITVGPDRNLWFTESNGNIGRITTSGNITEYTVPTVSDANSGITAGRDGNLWFTEKGGNNIGRITTSGNVTEFALPPPLSEPNYIAVGPDGNLWFTESNGGEIGKFVP